MEIVLFVIRVNSISYFVSIEINKMYVLTKITVSLVRFVDTIECVQLHHQLLKLRETS